MTIDQAGLNGSFVTLFLESPRSPLPDRIGSVDRVQVIEAHLAFYIKTERVCEVLPSMLDDCLHFLRRLWWQWFGFMHLSLIF
ncbi:hypothetical protein Bpro_5369 (plasmid) [Polaromonas sp. JS666]|nr:hypothetical protein Bpro_5369 [Polaromonas sp. JS666]